MVLFIENTSLYNKFTFLLKFELKDSFEILKLLI